jgi:hypothetical protein
MESVAVKNATRLTQCLGREALAERLAITPRVADILMKTGVIKSMRIGRRRVVSESALLEFIRKQESKLQK